jgi:hypothetical protein
MTTEHPITPPPELIEDWIEIAKPLPQRPPNPNELATLAARWGADQELEACCEWIYKLMDRGLEWSMDLRIVRRPKPPSLKEQALEAVNALEDFKGVDIIRRALESLPDD